MGVDGWAIGGLGLLTHRHAAMYNRCSVVVCCSWLIGQIRIRIALEISVQVVACLHRTRCSEPSLIQCIDHAIEHHLQTECPACSAVRLRADTVSGGSGRGWVGIGIQCIPWPPCLRCTQARPVGCSFLRSCVHMLHYSNYMNGL